MCKTSSERPKILLKYRTKRAFDHVRKNMFEFNRKTPEQCHWVLI